MKRYLTAVLLLLLSLPAAAQSVRDSVALATARWQTTPLGNGAEARTAQVELFGAPQHLALVIYPERAFATRVVQVDGRGRIPSRIGQEAGAEAAINGSYFNMREVDPITFTLSDGKVVNRGTMHNSPLSNGVVAARGRKDNRVEVFPCDSALMPELAEPILMSEPTLLPNP